MTHERTYPSRLTAYPAILRASRRFSRSETRHLRAHQMKERDYLPWSARSWPVHEHAIRRFRLRDQTILQRPRARGSLNVGACGLVEVAGRRGCDAMRYPAK